MHLRKIFHLADKLLDFDEVNSHATLISSNETITDFQSIQN